METHQNFNQFSFRKLILMILMAYLVQIPVQAANPEKEGLGIKYIDLVHFTHTDIGYTDHPELLQELHRRYIDIAIDAAVATQKSTVPFCWTAEALEPLNGWWNEADKAKRKSLLKMLETGQFEVTAFPYNMSATMGEPEIQEVKDWIPRELWHKFKIVTAVQNDVNATTRATIMQLLNNGVKYLWTGINPVIGGAPSKRPAAFWWKMPDGRKIFVWLSEPYWSGYDLFAGKEYRYNGQTKAANACVWTPNPGDMLMSDEKYVLECHAHVTHKLKELKSNGYSFDFLITSFTNEWRCDNDPPFIAVTDFVATWNRLGLQPRLNLTTIGNALSKAEKSIASKIPEYEGEWIDWWAFGMASMPREIAAARRASRNVSAIQSPVWEQNLSERSVETLKKIKRELVLFHEHTYGANTSETEPYGSHNLGQLYSVFNQAHRPEAYSEWLLSQRLRSELIPKGEGLYLVNTTNADYTGWVAFDPRGYRGANIKSFNSVDNGYKAELFENLIWVNELKAHFVSKFLPDSNASELSSNQNIIINKDSYGWPASVIWNKKDTINIPEFGTFQSVTIQGANTRNDFNRLREIHNSAAREEKRESMIYQIPATIKNLATIQENNHTIRFTQRLDHPSLDDISRVIEIYKDKKLIRVKYSIDRKSSARPEVYFVKFPIPSISKNPVTSLGGINYRPYAEQLPGSNKDFMVVDEWVFYPEQNGGWLWTTVDAPLVTFGEHNVEKLRQNAPENISDLYCMVYNNRWYTNYIDNVVGKMEFEFYLQWVDKKDEGRLKEISAGTVSKPLVIINPKTFPDPNTMKYLYQNK